MLVRAFVGPGQAIAWPDPTYSLYPVLADIQDARGIALPWDAGWQLPVEALLAAGAQAIFFANPNAPSGTRGPARHRAGAGPTLRRPGAGGRGLLSTSPRATAWRWCASCPTSWSAAR